MSNQPGNYGGTIMAPASNHIMQELINIKVVLNQIIGKIQSTNSHLECGFTDMVSILTNIKHNHLQVRRDTVELLRVAYLSRAGDSISDKSMHPTPSQSPPHCSVEK